MTKIYLTAAVIAALLKAGPAWSEGPAPQGADTATSDASAPTPADAGATQADDQAASELREHHRHHHNGGITKFIAMSLDTLGEDDAKRPQIEKLQHDLHVCLASGGKVEKGVLKTIADGVASGSIDATKVDSAIAQLGTVSSDEHRCSVKTLNKLHAILSPEERQALVDKVQAHWQVWRQVNHEGEMGGKERDGRLAELAKELALAPDQVEKISAQLQAASAPTEGQFDPKKAEEHLQAFAAAFAGKSFNAKSIMADADNHLATHGAKRMALFYEMVTPLLTPEQRTALAEHLREHANQQPS